MDYIDYIKYVEYKKKTIHIIYLSEIEIKHRINY